MLRVGAALFPNHQSDLFHRKSFQAAAQHRQRSRGGHRPVPAAGPLPATVSGRITAGEGNRAPRIAFLSQLCKQVCTT